MFIDGTPFDDALPGTADDDLIIGREGNDVIKAYEGNDIIVGANHLGANPGQGERDILVSGPGNDMYVLGLDNNPFYRDPGLGFGTAGFAAIADFELGFDRIRIDPNSNYMIMDFAVPGYGNGAGIFYIEDPMIGDQRLDLVGLVDGVSASDLSIVGNTIG